MSDQYKEVWISPRERALLRYIREQHVIGHSSMVTVQSANGKKGFGFPRGENAIAECEAYIEM